MRKILLIAMVFIFAVGMYPVMVQGATSQPAFIVDYQLDRKAEIEAISTGEYAVCVAEYTNQDIKITAKSDNANWFLGYFCDFDAESHKFIKLRIRNECPGDTFEVWASKATSGNYEIRLDLWKVDPNSSQYKEYIFDISENIGSGSWAGQIKRIRLDFIVSPNPNKDQYIYLDYFAVFNSKAEAEAFNIDQWEAANPPGSNTPALPVSNGYPSFLLDFKAKNKSDIEKLVASAPGDCTVEFLEDALCATASVNNANWRYGINVDVHTALTQYVKVRLKNETSGTKFEFWTSSTTNTTYLPVGIQMPISTKDTEYKEYIFKLSDYLTQGLYINNLGTLRIDFSETPRPSTGEKFYIDYIAFFATKEEAEHFHIVEYRAGTWKPLTPTTTGGGSTTSPITFDFLPIYFIAIPAAVVMVFAITRKRRCVRS